jgi:histidinol dehydrogenase
MRYSPEALARDANAVRTLARLEGLEGHARAVEARLVRSESS